MSKHKVKCLDCGAIFTEVYPNGLDDSEESYSDIDDPKPCDCDSQYELVHGRPSGLEEVESYTKIYKKAVSILAANLTKEELVELHGEWDSDGSNDLFWMFSEEVAKVAPEEFTTTDCDKFCTNPECVCMAGSPCCSIV